MPNELKLLLTLFTINGLFYGLVLLVENKRKK
jgi:hypothetical protein